MPMIVEIGNVNRKPDVTKVEACDTVTVRRKEGRGVGFVEVEIGPSGRVRIRSWSKLVLHVESSNVIDVEEAST